MIITVRGSHGSGKSTCVRRVLKSYHEAKPVMAPGRRRPLAYLCDDPDLRRSAIVGSYENPTGGCDTISSVDVIYDLIRTYAASGIDVLFEGILAQHCTSRLIELSSIYDVRVIVLTTSDDDCVASVRERRGARGASVAEFDPSNVLKECKSVRSSTRRLQDVARAGTFQGDGNMHVELLDREAAFARCRELLMMTERPHVANRMVDLSDHDDEPYGGV